MNVTKVRKIVDIIPYPFAPIDSEFLLKLAASAAADSEHFAARCLASAARERDAVLLSASHITHWPDRGLEAVIGGNWVHLGTADLMRDKMVDVADLAGLAADLSASGKIVIFVALERQLIGLIAVV